LEEKIVWENYFAIIWNNFVDKNLLLTNINLKKPSVYILQKYSQHKTLRLSFYLKVLEIVQLLLSKGKLNLHSKIINMKGNFTLNHSSVLLCSKVGRVF
jgi:hypothetical protein